MILEIQILAWTGTKLGQLKPVNEIQTSPLGIFKPVFLHLTIE
jgi:hypothetical protein